MTRRRINHIPGDKIWQLFNPAVLVVLGDLDPHKLEETGRRQKPIIVMECPHEGAQYVVDGRHAAMRAKLRGDEHIEGILVGESTPIGKQTALERVVGMMSRNKEGK